MRKERCLLGCLNQIKLSCRKSLSRKVVMRDLIRHLRIFVSEGMVNWREKIRRSRITNFRDDKSLCYNGKAFTLIELLVVVLIIGILAAVAVPQYQKAVAKSRAMQLLTLVKSMATAQQAYYLANGEYATQFGELSLDVDSLTPGDTSMLAAGALASNADVARYNDLFEIRLQNDGSVHSSFRTGKYKGCGIQGRPDGSLYCMEWHYYYKDEAGSFCKQIMKAGDLEKDKGNARFYPL